MGDNMSGPKLNLPDYATKSIFDYPFLPMSYIAAIATKMQDNGKARYDKSSGNSDYKYWTVTSNDVLQWIGVWLSVHAGFPNAWRSCRLSSAPENDFGPRHSIKSFLRIGCPSQDRGVFWFNQMCGAVLSCQPTTAEQAVTNSTAHGGFGTRCATHSMPQS